jgi:hypothetical protein
MVTEITKDQIGTGEIDSMPGRFFVKSYHEFGRRYFLCETIEEIEQVKQVDGPWCKVIDRSTGRDYEFTVNRLFQYSSSYWYHFGPKTDGSRHSPRVDTQHFFEQLEKDERPVRWIPADNGDKLFPIGVVQASQLHEP